MYKDTCRKIHVERWTGRQADTQYMSVAIAVTDRRIDIT